MANILIDLNKLKIAQQNIDRPEFLNKFLKRFSNEFASFELESKRDHSLRECLKTIFITLENKQLELNGNGEIDLKTFKKDMIDTQELIQNIKIKIKNNWERLKDDERELGDELALFNKNLSQFTKPINCNIKKNFLVSSNISNRENQSNVCNEVQQFRDFINKSNGHQNGWSNEDHLLFLKLRKKHKSVNSIAIKLNRMLPDLSEEDIRKHELWYRKYLNLNSKMKEAVGKWREKRVEDKVVREEVSGTVQNRNVKIETKEIKEKIAIWKKEKEIKRKELEHIEFEKKQLKSQTESRKQIVQEQIKKEVEKWKETKMTEQKIECLEKEILEVREKRARSVEANKLIKQYQEQDSVYIDKMKLRNTTKPKRRDYNIKPIVIVERNPERVLNPTKQWLRRSMRSSNEDVAAEIPDYVLNLQLIPKLKIPDWRKNICGNAS